MAEQTTPLRESRAGGGVFGIITDHLRGHLTWAICAGIAGALVFWSYYLPLWNMTLTAPQYPKGLTLVAYGTGMDGPLREINALNHYIGAQTIDPDTVWEFKLFPYVIGVAHTLLFIGAFMKSRWWRMPSRVFVASVPIVFLIDLQWWLYRFGHDLSPEAALDIDTFTPKVIGDSQLVNFHSSTMVDTGFWVIVAAGLLVTVVPAIISFAAASWKNTGSTAKSAAAALALGATLLGLATDSHHARAAGSLQSMVDAAQPGSTLSVPAGTYEGALTIDKPLTLIGEGQPVIRGDGQHDVVVVTADDVTIRGFVIEHSGRDVTPEETGIRLKGNRAVIEDNLVRDTLYGITLHGTNGHTIKDNTVIGIPDFDSSRRGHAIYLWNANDNIITGNTVDGAKDGIYLSTANGNDIENNTITNARYGIHYMYSNNNVIDGNVLRDNIGGASMMYSKQIEIIGNEFSYAESPASGYGILFRDVDDVVMRDNLIHHNRVGLTMEGVPFTPGHPFLATHNLIGYNEVGFDLTSTVNVTFSENSIVGNLRQVQTRGGSLTDKNQWSLNGRGNYWDDYQGYDANGDGVGDLKYEYESLFHDMVDEHPVVQAYTFTPAQTALEVAARWFPVYRPDPLAVDSNPLMRQSINLQSSSGFRAAVNSAAVGGALMLVPLMLILAMRLRTRKGWANAELS